MKLFDLHCDTPYELFHRHASLKKNDLHISLNKTIAYSAYIQSAAIWSDCRLSDSEAWDAYLSIQENFKREIAINPDAILAKNAQDLIRAADTGKRCFIQAVEDARILDGDLSRLDRLREDGVRLLTLCWAGKSCIGGSHDTSFPLSDFGADVVKRCFEYKITPDVSHASRAVTADVLKLAKEYRKPVVATHSNAHAIHPHTRNLTDEEFRAITDLGGVIGISLCPEHLTDGACDINAVVRHIQHYLRIGGEHSLCLGCDFDGIGDTPAGLENVARLTALADRLNLAGLSASTIERIFFDNAYGFAVENFQ